MQKSVIVRIRHADFAFVAGVCAHRPIISRHELLALALHAGIATVRDDGLEALLYDRGQRGKRPTSDPRGTSGQN